MGRLQDRRVLVTGASSGIGRAIAVACAAEGASVAGLARRGHLLQDLRASDGILPIAGDVTDLEDACSLVDRAVGELGGLDVLVNSAGIARPDLIADADPADWRAMFDVNVLGLLAVTQAAIPHLRDGDPTRGPSIIAISSMSGRRVPSPAGGTYSATKFAVHAICEALRLELQPDGIRVTTVSPGFVDTEIFDGQEGDLAARYRTLAGAMGIRADDVAEVVVHTLSAPASVTTVEVAVVATLQSDSTYAKVVAED